VSGARQITVGGHSARRGYYLMRTDALPDDTGKPLRFYQGQRLPYLWRLVDRFNRMSRYGFL
jgi:hypothetical protein